MALIDKITLLNQELIQRQKAIQARAQYDGLDRWQYYRSIQRMYEQNTAVIAVATQGIQRATDKNLRDISGEIRTKRTSENIKLSIVTRWILSNNRFLCLKPFS